MGIKIYQAKNEPLFNFLKGLFLMVFFILAVYPIIYVLSCSFSDPRAILSGKVWLFPVKPTLEGYIVTFKYDRILVGLRNSFFYAGVGTIINILLTIMAAYPLSRKDLRGRNLFMFIFAFTMWFSGGLIPSYMLVKDLHMINKVWALLIPNALSVWNMIIAKTYFETTIPAELHESAHIDGCDDFTFIRKILIPLSGPIIAVITLFYAVGHWNAFFSAFLYLSKRDLFPIQLILREIIIMNQSQDAFASFMYNIDTERQIYLAELLKYSIIVVSSIPVIIMYLFTQKYIVKGVMIGAIKG